MISAVAEALELIVGRPHGDRVTVRVLGRVHADADDHWDGNWLRFTIDGLDQTDLPAMVSALVAIERAYPLLGGR
ncbi:hypothetical protein Asi02nite_66320 [Asanoa siamensis]|uniref:Uncharacterized protein n=1 Tax=Asanoa siamensis TaxID=926357 RepID=A0ABQ4D0P4_9ACTN|nr:hypothetical protein Asi02nite_66320 [Asanoa siamensis]